MSAIVLNAVSIYISAAYPSYSIPFFYNRIIPFTGFIASLGVLFAAHFSYPRIHNKRIYVCGYLCGFIGIVFFVLNRPAFITPLYESTPVGFLGTVLLVQMVNILIFPMLSSNVKYRSARSTMLFFLIIEAVFLITMRFAPDAIEWIRYIWFYEYNDLGFWIGPAIFLTGLILNIWKVRDDFFLGGIFTGCALFYSMIWILGITENRVESIQSVLFTITPLYLLAGMLVHSIAKMENRISYDPLLQIYNREFCSKIISEQSKFNTNPPFAVAMVDIDHFKNVNDTYGHQAGDTVLYSVAQAVSSSIGSEGVVCRYGGEELSVFFPQKSTGEAVELMEKVRMDIEKIVTVSGKKKISVTVSVGVSMRENGSQTVMDVISAADKALYRAKNGGRNQVKSGKITKK